MKNISIIFVSIFLVLLTACNNEQKAILTETKQKGFTMKDPHSYAKPYEARINSLDLSVEVLFEGKILNCIANYTIVAANEAKEIILDTKALNIKEVFLNDTIRITNYTIGKTDPILGAPLHIPISADTRSIQIHYQTSQQSAALQWLSAQQTSGEHPFLFTQSQAILCRSWIPIQDSPSIKFTYTAEVKVPSGYLALMSASNPKEIDTLGTYSFKMDRPIPAYLMALAVGNLQFHEYDSVSGVYAEPAVMPLASKELEQLDQMIAAAEKLYGEYLWGRFDVLMLPSSFPFGGMENPKLTFATPTILVGDKSLTSLIAHELAHSWSGNLVTNASWSDFWLNEGFTVYFEYRIMEEVYGKDYAEMLSAISYKELKEEVEEMMEAGNAKDTHLKLNLEGRDPDEGLTAIAYDKGYFFLKRLEEITGRKQFDAFLKKYFNEHAFKTITTEEFILYTKQHLFVKNNIELPGDLFHDWIYSPALPQNFPTPSSERFNQVESVLSSWLNSKDNAYLTATNWSTHEYLHFLHELPDSVTTQDLALLDQAFDLTSSNNAEIQMEWFLIGIKKAYRPIYAPMEKFLINTGRRKFLMPLYKALKESDERLAKRIYEKARPNYHFVAYNSLDNLLKVQY